jgi:predicted metal-dependent hydrolase
MTPASAASEITVDLGSETVSAQVVRSPRARVTRIQVGRDRPLRVIVPDGASDDLARDAVISKKAWVKRKLADIRAAQARPAQLGLDTPDVVWRHGQPIPVQLADVRFAVERDGTLLAPRHGDRDEAIQRWYRRTARSFLRALVAEEAARLGLRPSRVIVRDQRTRWGSCARSGTISLNWRLLVAPEPVARYVVVHELTHMTIPNHSKAFWRTLAAACPEWRTQDAWLREHGDELRRFGG